MRGAALVPPPAALGLSVALSGRIASGKTSLAKMLSDRLGIRRISFGSAVRHMLPASRDPTRGQLQDCGQRIMEAHGPEWLLRRALEQHDITLSCGVRAIFDGVRHVSMVTEIRRISRVSCVLFVDARPDVRLARYMSRSRGGDAKAFRKADGHRVEAELGRVRREADLVIENSGNDLDATCARAEEVLSMCGSTLSRGARRAGAGSAGKHARRGSARSRTGAGTGQAKPRASSHSGSTRPRAPVARAARAPRKGA